MHIGMVAGKNFLLLISFAKQNPGIPADEVRKDGF